MIIILIIIDLKKISFFNIIKIKPIKSKVIIVIIIFIRIKKKE